MSCLCNQICVGGLHTHTHTHTPSKCSLGCFMSSIYLTRKNENSNGIVANESSAVNPQRYAEGTGAPVPTSVLVKHIIE